MSTPSSTQAPADEPAAPVRRSGRHPVDIGHLVMGVAFTGLLVVWLLVVTGVVEGDDVRLLLPVPWVVAGAAGLVGLVAADRRRASGRPPATMEG